MPTSERLLSRREFLKDLTSFTILPSLATPQILDINEQPLPELISIPEAETTPRYGDVLISGNEAYLLKPEGLYLLPEGLDVYNKKSGANEFGSRVFSISNEAIEQIPLTLVSPLFPIIDQTGDAKAHRHIQ